MSNKTDESYISFVYDNPQDIGSYDFVPVIELSDDDKKRDKLNDTDFHCDSIYNRLVFHNLSPTGELIETAIPILEYQIPNFIDYLVNNCPICKKKFENKSKNKAMESFKYNLNNYIDADKRNNTKNYVLLHRKEEIELTFDVKKGNRKANDDDGYVKAFISPARKGISIVGDDTFKTGYNKQIKIKISVKPDKTVAYDTELFDINFLAYDNYEDWFDIKGGAKDKIHCGQFGVISRNCICEDWSTISSVIPASNFIGWATDGIRNCYKLAVKQLKEVDYAPADSGYDIKSSNLFQIFKDNIGGTNNEGDKINDLNSEADKQRFRDAISYLKEALNDGAPILVGVDDQPGHPGNGDQTTDHFIVIVGMGKDENGCYFLFYDNATSSQSVGTSNDNKLYCDCVNYLLSGSGHSDNTYLTGSTYMEYTVTQIRKSKKNK